MKQHSPYIPHSGSIMSLLRPKRCFFTICTQWPWNVVKVISMLLMTKLHHLETLYRISWKIGSKLENNQISVNYFCNWPGNWVRKGPKPQSEIETVHMAFSFGYVLPKSGAVIFENGVSTAKKQFLRSMGQVQGQLHAVKVICYRRMAKWGRI